MGKMREMRRNIRAHQTAYAGIGSSVFKSEPLGHFKASGLQLIAIIESIYNAVIEALRPRAGGPC